MSTVYPPHPLLPSWVPRSSWGDRYIETLPKKGYRFTFPVQGIASPGPPSPPATNIGADSEEIGRAVEGADPLPAPAFRSKRLSIAVVSVASIAVLALTQAWRDDGSPQQPQPAPTAAKSIVVLPLENVSGDPEQEYFADGMTDALISSLGKITALKVISRTSAMRYKGSDKPLPQIAGELNVGHVVEGSVLQIEGQVRITAQLADAANDQQVWSNSCQRPVEDILRLQSDVARAIAREIEVNLTPREETGLAVSRQVDPEAHAAYLKGQYWLDKYEAEKALEFLRRAVEKDPEHARAWVALAEAYARRAAFGVRGISLREARTKSRAAIRRAQLLDDTLPEFHAVLGVKKELDFDWSGAEQSFRRALELNPSLAVTHQQYAHLLIMTGRREQARAEMERALELDPFSLLLKAAMAWQYNFLGEHDDAIELCDDVLDMDSSFVRCNVHKGWAYVHKGIYSAALAEFEKVVHANWARPKASIGYVYALQGRKDEALKILDELHQLSKQGHVSPYLFALLHLGMGNHEQSLDWLDRSYEEADFSLPANLPADRAFDPLRSHPRFRGLLKRMNLAD